MGPNPYYRDDPELQEGAWHRVTRVIVVVAAVIAIWCMSLAGLIPSNFGAGL